MGCTLWFKKIVLKNLDYIESRMTDEDYIEYDWQYTHCGHDMGQRWVSGMAQGEMIAAFIRGYLLTNDDNYLKTAEKYFRTLLRKPGVDDYWCSYVDENNYYWIEEYPNPDKCHVLNGMMYALWGVWEYYVITRDDDAKIVFQAGLKSILDNYTEIWLEPARLGSMYCKHGHASEHYHDLHIELFGIFDSYFDLPELKQAKQAFENQPPWPEDY